MATQRGHPRAVGSISVATTVHQLKVTLKGVKPPVWRRVLVPSSWTLAELSPALESVMGWHGGHLHAFDTGDSVYGQPDPDWGGGLEDERKARLDDVLPQAGAKMRWDYDFGDGWEHEVVAEAIVEPDAGLRYPYCKTGRRACPPEDCGGPYGYQDLVDALTDPNHPRREELEEWVPPGFDPARFDLREINDALRRH